jgi:hypothetical protein
MVYAYPPPGQGTLRASMYVPCGILMIMVGFYQGEANGKQSKRKQVKMAVSMFRPFRNLTLIYI